VWISPKPLITEEIWPDQGMNLGLPNDTWALYPLLRELMQRSVEKSGLGYLCLELFGFPVFVHLEKIEAFLLAASSI
jgi:hypothetical protein